MATSIIYRCGRRVVRDGILRAIASKQILDKLAPAIPSPAKNMKFPLWVYIASNISMRFHGVHQFNAYPYVVRAGGMVQAFGPKMGRRPFTPILETFTLSCEGFTTRTTMAGQTPSIRTTCARWRAEPMWSYCISGSTGMSRAFQTASRLRSGGQSLSGWHLPVRSR